MCSDDRGGTRVFDPDVLRFIPYFKGRIDRGEAAHLNLPSSIEAAARST
jgi:hypothetical protein